MTLEEYRQLIISITKMHIKTAQSELDNSIMLPEERLLKEGYINGLNQAVYTLEHSEFLTKKEEEGDNEIVNFLLKKEEGGENQ